MKPRDWDFWIWQQAGDLIEQAARIHRNFLQVASHYQGLPSRAGNWVPPVNVVEPTGVGG